MKYWPALKYIRSEHTWPTFKIPHALFCTDSKLRNTLQHLLQNTPSSPSTSCSKGDLTNTPTNYACISTSSQKNRLSDTTASDHLVQSELEEQLSSESVRHIHEPSRTSKCHSSVQSQVPPSVEGSSLSGTRVLEADSQNSRFSLLSSSHKLANFRITNQQQYRLPNDNEDETIGAAYEQIDSSLMDCVAKSIFVKLCASTNNSCKRIPRSSGDGCNDTNARPSNEQIAASLHSVNSYQKLPTLATFATRLISSDTTSNEHSACSRRSDVRVSERSEAMFGKIANVCPASFAQSDISQCCEADSIAKDLLGDMQCKKHSRARHRILHNVLPTREGDGEDTHNDPSCSCTLVCSDNFSAVLIFPGYLYVSGTIRKNLSDAPFYFVETSSKIRGSKHLRSKSCE